MKKSGLESSMNDEKNGLNVNLAKCEFGWSMKDLNKSLSALKGGIHLHVVLKLFSQLLVLVFHLNQFLGHFLVFLS